MATTPGSAHERLAELRERAAEWRRTGPACDDTPEEQVDRAAITEAFREAQYRTEVWTTSP